MVVLDYRRKNAPFSSGKNRQIPKDSENNILWIYPAAILPELPGVRIPYSQFAVDGDNEFPQGEEHVPGILPVHGPGRMPDHLSAQQGREFIDFCSPEFFRKDETFHVVSRPVPSLFRGECEVHCDQCDIRDKPMTEPVLHGEMMGTGVLKRYGRVQKMRNAVIQTATGIAMIKARVSARNAHSAFFRGFRVTKR